ncbi:unnamed protein product [Triticum turgidum subsp. durum]|uniref:F-box domain-containing protein n=1 Tax=Triticum turgidum subsp. durum TaxID=4567 RepID=A0A9R1ABL4_TRITD|nr:unnamed protein product [Triticum turgidum subsp. durum]
MAISKRKTASPLTDLPDHLLTEILLRLPVPADLARASATCVSFRRLATERFLLHRFRRLHEPPLLGFLECDGFHPALPPHASAPAARALALAADFSFSFLPSHCRWTVQDCRDGRVLLNRGSQPSVFQELAVCDPLHRRYILLPPVPDDLAHSVEHLLPKYNRSRCKPFLVPLREEETAEETAFKVIWMAHCKTKLSAFVFSSSTGIWQAAASKSWNDLALDIDDLVMMPQLHPSFLRRHYAYGCFYWDWVIIRSEKLLVLDIRSMEFSIANLPPGDWSKKGVAIVEAGEGRLGIFAAMPLHEIKVRVPSSGRWTRQSH